MSKIKGLYLIAISVTILMFGIDAKSQDIHGTFSNMTGVAQSSYVNPAYLSKYKIVIAVPGIGLGINLQSPLTYNQVLKQEGTTYTIDAKSILSSLKDVNKVGFNSQTDVIFASFRVLPRWHVHLYSSLRTQVFFRVPEEATSLLINGNELNRTYNIEFQGVANTWLENAIGASYKVDDKITVGLRLKLNKGIAGAKVNKAKATVQTTDTSIITTADLDVQTIDYDKISGEINASTFDYNKYLGGLTFGLDLGATYHEERWWAGIAISNLIGSVNYAETLRYTLNPETAKYEYKGVNIQDVIDGVNTDNTVVENAFTTTNVKSGEMTISLPTTYHLNGEYTVIPTVRAGGTFTLQTVADSFETSYGVTATKDFARIWTLSLSFSRIYGKFCGGLGTSLQLGPVQLYLASDNSLSSAFSMMTQGLAPTIKDTRALNFKFGINLVFGRLKNQLQFKNI